MFTGIVTAVGRIQQSAPMAGGVRLTIAAHALGLDDVAIGDSIAVDGVCLTVTGTRAESFDVDVSRETLDCTVGFEPGAAVNLEKAMRLSDRLGGHLVSGHVDGTGTVVRFEPVGENRLVTVQISPDLARYVARKGSVTVNGVSLTVNEVQNAVFSVNLIPHTLGASNLGASALGRRVNIEVDLIARYVEQMLPR